MPASSGSVFSETLQTITSTKLEELAKQRTTFEEKYKALIGTANAEPNPLKRVCLLLDGSKECLGVQTVNDTKDGRPGRVIHSGNQYFHLITNLRNLDRFIEHARFDPSVSSKVLADWEQTLLQYLSVQSTKFQYADLYGKLVAEWLSSENEKSTNDDGDIDITGSFEEVPGAKKLASRAEWESEVFQAAEVDERALRSYLEDLFTANKEDGTAALGELRKKVDKFETRLSSSTQFDVKTLCWTIQGLQNSDFLSNEKREALRDFLGNEVILRELCDILNVRMNALDRWTWGPQVLLEQRRKINGDFSIHFDPDLLQAIFLHHIGVKWSVFFKTSFLDLHKHKVWQRKLTEISKIDRLRRSYFLGDKGIDVSQSLEQKRKGTHHYRYFAHQLLDFDRQQVEAEEGEEEAEFGDYVEKKRKIGGFVAYGGDTSQEPRVGRAKQTARKAGGAMNYSPPSPCYSPASPPSPVYTDSEEDADNVENAFDLFEHWDAVYHSKPKNSMEAKQDLLHIVSTEIIVNTRLHGELTCFRTTFDSWYSLLPHQTIFAVLDFLGISKKWKEFFTKYLEAPLRFMDDPSSEPRLRRRGMPGSHTLSDSLGETVLLCLDFAVNQATGGAELYRIGDDVWFWNKDYETCAAAWGSILKFTEIMGVKLNDKKTGSVRISHDKSVSIDDRLPEGGIHWGFLRLDEKSGRFDIDQNMVDGHVDELRVQLQSKSKSVIDYIQTWNSYAATFFSSNFGKPSNCFGREHVDKMLATHRRIQESIFPNGGIAQHIKEMIEERFSVKNVPDGFLFFPIELGGLDLKSPFVSLLQIRDSVEENPYDLLDEYERKERDDYDTAKRAFDKGDTRRNAGNANWKPEDPDEFFSFEEFIKLRESFGSIGRASLSCTYKQLLEQPLQEPVNLISLSMQLSQALKQLSGQRNLRGILGHWPIMDDYWKWIAQMYGPEMISTFGGLNVVDFGLLPIGMVSMFRQRRTKWQG